MNVMEKSQITSTTPIPVRRAIRKLGQDIRDARRRRRIPVHILAERASISRTTLYKVENGDTNVSIGIYGTVLFVLGMVDRLANLADASQDVVGRELAEEHLPKRIRLPRSQKPSKPDTTPLRAEVIQQAGDEFFVPA